MKEMFETCSSLEFLDLSNFNTMMCKNFDNMFGNCNENLHIIADSNKAMKMIQAIENTVNVTDIAINKLFLE